MQLPSVNGNELPLQISPSSIAVDPVALINTECITVTSAMRKHARWAHSSVSAILGGASSTSLRMPYSPSAKELGTTTSKRQSNGPPIRSSSALSTQPAGGDEDGIASRWGLRGKRGKSLQDNPLMSAFARLRSDLRGCTDIRTVDIPALLHPFLQVIRSSSTSAPITSLALVAIGKFFAYNIITKDSPRLSLGMQLLSAAITHCRFEASDSAADEIVLLRILKLMEDMLAGPGGDLLGDESVCEMMETGLSMCCQVRLSELLRRSAEISMVTMCQLLFERLKRLEDEPESPEFSNNAPATEPEGTTLRMEAPLKGKNTAAPQFGKTPLSAEFNAADKESIQAGRSSASFEQVRVNGPSTADLTQTATPANLDEAEIKPYSLPSIRELFRVLVNLLEPHDRQHTDSMRIMALRIIDVALEVAGPSIAKHPSLASLAKDDLCRHLFQLVRSDNMNLLNESLRVAGTLLATCRSVLKLQQELFLSYMVACLHPKVEIPREPGIDPSLYDGIPNVPKLVKPPPSQASSGRSTPVPVKDRQKLGMEGGSRKPDAREAMVESIGTLVRIPSFLAELFVNYDCEVDRGDLCEDMIGLLSRNAFPDSATWSTTNVPPLCLDALLGYAQFIADRLNQEPNTVGYPDKDHLRHQRARKKVIIKGVTRFNENPKAGIAYLSSQGIIEDADDPESVARFLKGTTRVSKKVLGDYISKKSNEHILNAFLDQFNFSNKRVDEALREMLVSFRLPGESPLIERIVDVFSEKYCASAAPDGISHKDTVYVLTYAIIMLNTDQHNPNVKPQNRMDYTAFARNLRGVNDGRDFPPEYLQDIYDSIKTNEIILPDEHDNQHAFDYAWKELLVKTENAGDLQVLDTNIYDADMFAATWKPVVATLSYVFMSATEDAVYQRVVAGFDQCAQIAAKYNISDALDHIIYCLSTISMLAPEIPPSTALNTEVQIGKRNVMVSELAVKFGRDYRAQLATVVLFKGVIADNESSINVGWKWIIRIWLNLFVNSLIPANFSPSKPVLEIPPIPVQAPSQVINRGERNNDSGLFSTFTSYLATYTADDPPEPSDEELNDTLCTVDCLAACPMTDVFTNLITLPIDSLRTLVLALLDELPENPSPVVITVKSDPSSPNSAKTNGHRTTSSKYDPNAVFILELVTLLAIRDSESIDAVGKDVSEALQNTIRDGANVHPMTISRTIFYLFHVLKQSHEHTFIRVPVILHTIAGLQQSILEKSALPILKGLALCLDEPGALRNEIANTPDFWNLLRSLHTIPAATGGVFELVESIIKGKPTAITADNYEPAVALLKDFATAGSTGAVAEQKREAQRGPRRMKPVKQPTAKDNESVALGVKAVTMIQQLSNRVPFLIQQSHLELHEAWTTYWSPIFLSLSTQCVNPCREIRQNAFNSLQRALLSPGLASPEHSEWTAIFSEVLFPLIMQLMKPEVYQTDPQGMSETRVQAATLLCKIFLHYLAVLEPWEGFVGLWGNILEIMERLMGSGQGESLEEAVPESLKNILLVMSSGGYLVRPEEAPDKASLWDETWKRLERFLPRMYREIFPKTEDASEEKGQEKTGSEDNTDEVEKPIVAKEEA
ncbi:GDP/GTP exchange factor for ARF [Agyrium rufum]|nr:GDP/GTP exchange factor for ARF [Agyrium rufum]